MRLDLGLNLGIYNSSSSAPVNWTPAELPNLALWLDAEDAASITLNGSTVAQWSDKSGNARHVSQATVVNQPAYTANGLNGKPVLTFTGTNFLSRTNDTFLQNAPAVSIFLVVAYNNYTTSRRAVNVTAVSTGATRVVLFGTAGSLQSLARRLSAEAISVSSGTPAAANTPVIHGSQLNFVNNSNTEVVNGVVATAATFSSGAGNSESNLINFEIGAAVTTQLFLGTMAEAIFISGILSTTDRQRLEGYLAWKWGLVANLPSGHPFKNTPPTV